ncbi:hypothetical protein C1O28_09765 [Rathayibacter rathayi]|nr:hypothetical protein C1O28_09765 [Rathayibacter rathayi]
MRGHDGLDEVAAVVHRLAVLLAAGVAPSSALRHLAAAEGADRGDARRRRLLRAVSEEAARGGDVTAALLRGVPASRRGGRGGARPDGELPGRMLEKRPRGQRWPLPGGWPPTPARRSPQLSASWRSRCASWPGRTVTSPWLWPVQPQRGGWWVLCRSPHWVWVGCWASMWWACSSGRCRASSASSGVPG